MRLIDADELKKAIYEWRYHGYYDKLIELIDNAPTVEDHSRELVQKSLELGRHVGYFEGKTENKRPQGEWKCPECGEWLFACPNCGADMRGKKNE